MVFKPVSWWPLTLAAHDTVMELGFLLLWLREGEDGIRRCGRKERSDQPDFGHRTRSPLHCCHGARFSVALGCMRVRMVLEDDE